MQCLKKLRKATVRNKSKAISYNSYFNALMPTLIVIALTSPADHRKHMSAFLHSILVLKSLLGIAR